MFQYVHLDDGCALHDHPTGLNNVFVYIDQTGVKISLVYADYGYQILKYRK